MAGRQPPRSDNRSRPFASLWFGDRLPAFEDLLGGQRVEGNIFCRPRWQWTSEDRFAIARAFGSGPSHGTSQR
ncbi:unnamed protein product [Soboliphyme baturini]|uniref:IRF tryptophan pentad repeat domain-containing protein n=1 Tax=Soboliphyme baturini TaxID=241478 RepID=A0A183J6W9_9BILA|nr:unnamed protein product [Soboliphyme baturini]